MSTCGHIICFPSVQKSVSLQINSFELTSCSLFWRHTYSLASRTGLEEEREILLAVSLAPSVTKVSDYLPLLFTNTFIRDRDSWCVWIKCSHACKTTSKVECKQRNKRVKVTSDKGKSQECNPILSMTTSPVLFCLGGTHTENFISVSLQISLHVFWSLVSHRDGDFGQQLSEKQSEENNVEHVIVATGLELWEYKRNMLDRPSGKVSCSRRRVRFFTLWMQEEAGHWSVCLF